MCNVALVVYLASISGTDGLALVLPAILGVIHISDVIHSFDHDRSNSISQLINDKLRNLKKLFKYFNETATSPLNIVLLFGVLPINSVIYSKDLLVVILLLFVLIQAVLFSFVHHLLHLYNNSSDFLMS